MKTETEHVIGSVGDFNAYGFCRAIMGNTFLVTTKAVDGEDWDSPLHESVRTIGRVPKYIRQAIMEGLEPGYDDTEFGKALDVKGAPQKFLVWAIGASLSDPIPTYDKKKLRDEGIDRGKAMKINV